MRSSFRCLPTAHCAPRSSVPPKPVAFLMPLLPFGLLPIASFPRSPVNNSWVLSHKDLEESEWTDQQNGATSGSSAKRTLSIQYPITKETQRDPETSILPQRQLLAGSNGKQPGTSPRKLITVSTQLRTGHSTLIWYFTNSSSARPIKRTGPDCGGKLKIGAMDLGTLLTEKTTLKHLFRYVDSSNRFYHILEDLSELENED
ncbi:hypothetical protein EV360DRAFT_90883 [Lentinula raphanica]|nr:hypothetical protein EV360DRAFT_90883 [Lentinula raphanica]